MDDDDLRRGKPTLHIHAGEAMAILAGDAMLALAFGQIVQRVTDPALAQALVAELAHATTAMIAGQVYDTLGGLPPHLSPADQLPLIHRNKTGALIRASCRMGAMIGLSTPTPPPPSLHAITAYAEALGLMFQVTDDLLDALATTEQTGKRTRKDAASGKLTYPGVLGLDTSRRVVADLLAAALTALASLGEPAQPLRDLATHVAHRV